DDRLAAVAAGWSARMAGGVGLAHNPDHRAQYGWPTARASEVVAYVRDGASSLEQLASAILGLWMASPPHRATLLGDSWTDIGVGCAWSDDGRLYATANVIAA